MGNNSIIDITTASWKWAQRSINSFCVDSPSYTAMNSIALFLNWVFNSQSFQFIFVYNFTNMHAMSHRSYLCLVHSSRVNIYTPAFYYTITSLLTVSQVKLFSYQIPTAMLDSQSLTSVLLEVMITSENERVFIHDFSDLTLQIIFDAEWASISVGSKCSIASNHSRHAHSWHFYLQYAIGEPGSLAIIYIVCYQVLHHPSEHGTRSMGK